MEESSRWENIKECLEQLIPDPKCELDYHNPYELTIAVVLSAQTTDKAVNLVTPTLFSKYPDCYSLSNAIYDDVYHIICRLGLAKTKTSNIIALAKEVVNKYQGVIPNKFEDLTSLKGVGRKSANVILSLCFDTPRIAVDTHVERVSKRLGLVFERASTLKVEEELMRIVNPKDFTKAHHLLLLFGRYYCKSKNPLCDNCFYKDNCLYKK